MDMKLQLNDSQVEYINLERINKENSESIDDMEFSLTVETRFPIDDQVKHFLISFKSELQLKEGFILNVTYTSTFTTNVTLDESFQQSNFPKINAPAIAFPYFRAFISTFLLNAGFEPIILPSINFTKFKNSNE